MNGTLRVAGRLTCTLLALFAVLVAPRDGRADCSVIAPETFEHRGLLGSLSSPFLTPGLTTDVRVAGDECDQQLRSAAPDFRVGGVDQPADAFVVTVAFEPAEGSAPTPLLVLGADPALCDGIPACTVDAAAARQIAQVPLPGGAIERRLRLHFPAPPAFGPARLGVKLASDPQPVASELRDAACSDAAGAFVACVDSFFTLDGSCRTGAEQVSQPFSGLVAIPATDFTDVCTSGCDGAGPVASTLPLTTDRDGNALFAMDYASELVRVDLGSGIVEPRPRRLSLSLGDAAANGFTDDAPPVYAARPSSFTPEGFPLSPPFNPFVDPTVEPGQVGIWGMADAEFAVHFFPRRACSDDPARACRGDADCPGATCGAPEFSFAQAGPAVELPIAAATALQAVELNAWLDGSLDDDAVAITEDERLRGAPINQDGAVDDLVVELLDRTTGLLKKLRGVFEGRGLARVRVSEGERDFTLPSVAAEGRNLAFLESELFEGLADPVDSPTDGAAVRAADVNGNGRLDQSLRLVALADDPAAEQVLSLIPEDLHVAVRPELRFDGDSNLVLSNGKLVFAYTPLRQQPHAWQLLNQSSDGIPGNFFAGEATLSGDGEVVAFVSGADNLVASGPEGELSALTTGGTSVEAVTGPNGEFPVVANGQTVFEYRAIDDGQGSAPSRFYLELRLCDTASGEPDLEALFDADLSGPNADIKSEPTSCDGCSFEGSKLIEFDRGLGKGGSQSYSVVFDAPDVPAGEVGLSFKSGGQAEVAAIRGPVCIDPHITGGVPRVYVRDTTTGTTEIVSVPSRGDCGDRADVPDAPSGGPDLDAAGDLVFFQSAAALTEGDSDAEDDVFVYDRATCTVESLSGDLSGDLAGPASSPSSSDDGRFVAFQVGSDPQVVRLDRQTGELVELGAGQDPEISADGTKVVFTALLGGVSQVFLADFADDPMPVPFVVSVLDGFGGGVFPDGATEPSVSNAAGVAFASPPDDPDARLFVRDVPAGDTRGAGDLPTDEPLCRTSPCGAFSPSLSDDGLFLAYVVRGLGPVDEVMIADLTTGSLTPLTRMADADGDSFAPSLGRSGDRVALSSFASALGAAAGGPAEPDVFLEGPVDPTLDDRALLGFLDVASCSPGPCAPLLTGEPVTRGAVYEGAVAVVGSPVRVVQAAGGPAGVSVKSFGREGVDVALSGGFVCAIVDGDALGNPGPFAACGARSGHTLSDVTHAGAPLAADRIGLCGSRVVVHAPDGWLYEGDLAQGFQASPVGPAEDFELGDDLDLDDDGLADSCLVAFRTRETDLGGPASEVGNRDLDLDDLAMSLLGADGGLTDCVSSATDCPGQACRQFNYQVGQHSVVFIVDEADENFGFTPDEDPCAPGTDVNRDGRCDFSLRRCSADGALTSGTSVGEAGNPFAAGRFPDGENVVTQVGFCGTAPDDVRSSALCTADSDCLAGETCQQGFTALSALADTDGDEVPDVFDNCPTVFNPDQANSDVDDPTLDPDPYGDACDAFTCGDGELQDAEACDAGAANGTPGSSCSARCTCAVSFSVTETLKPGSEGSTPIVVYGSAAADGSGCLNLATASVGGHPPKSLLPTSLRLSATPPAALCPTAGGAPVHDLDKRQTYKSHLGDKNGDGITDLVVHASTPEIGGDASTTQVYLTGAFDPASGLGASCFEAVAPVSVSGN